MEGEGLVLALITVHEVWCLRHCMSHHFIMSSLLLCLHVASSLCPHSVSSLLSRCCGMSSSLCIVGVSSWCVLVLLLPGHCPVLSSCVCSFCCLMARALGDVSEVHWDECRMDSPNQMMHDNHCCHLSFG